MLKMLNVFAIKICLHLDRGVCHHQFLEKNQAMANKKNKKLMKKTNIFLQLFYYHYYLPLNLNFFSRRNRDEISNLFVSKYVFRILNISSIIFAQL